MKHVFAMGEPFRVPDGTLVSRFFHRLDDFSIAGGTIEPGTTSRIHVMPFVTQLTFLRSGELQVRMKSSRDPAPYTLALRPGEAALTERGTFFQLVNSTQKTCEVLYIVSPAYVFERDGYNDAVLVEDWQQAASELPAIAEREQAMRRLRGDRP